MAVVYNAATSPQNGTAPYIASLGFGTNSFAGTPTGLGGLTSSVAQNDQVCRWLASPPVPGSQLIEYGITVVDLSDLTLGDTDTGDDTADFAICLVDGSDNFVTPAATFITPDMVDYGAVSVFPTDTPGLTLAPPAPGVTGFFYADITPVVAVGYHAEILAFDDASGTNNITLTVSQIYFGWETEPPAANLWQVGSIGFSGQSTGFVG